LPIQFLPVANIIRCIPDDLCLLTFYITGWVVRLYFYNCQENPKFKLIILLKSFE
jgi:hypothetical protein